MQAPNPPTPPLRHPTKKARHRQGWRARVPNRGLFKSHLLIAEVCSKSIRKFHEIREVDMCIAIEVCPVIELQIILG